MATITFHSFASELTKTNLPREINNNTLNQGCKISYEF